MSQSFQYTKVARRMALRYPMGSSIVTQINFWVLAYLFFNCLIFFFLRAIASLFPEETVIHIWPNILIGTLFGILFGFITGLMDFYSERGILKRRAVGMQIVIRSLMYLIAFLVVWSIVGMVWNRVVGVLLLEGENLTFSETFQENFFLTLAIYTGVISLLINFIRQVNRSFGPGVLIPMILGRYRWPKVEDRVFMFMDLRSSTTYAEALGHEKYSYLIQDCFRDIDEVLPQFNAQIYQYVGDEVVLTWEASEGLKKLNCIRMYFAFRKLLEEKKEYYQEKYGLVPAFKAGLHMGEVMAAEIGDIKREIAYHGDTINTAARIQSVCNTHGQIMLISDYLYQELEWDNSFQVSEIGGLLLKGKQETVGIWGVTDASGL